MWTTQVPILNWTSIHRPSWNPLHDSDEEFTFLKEFFLQQYTPTNLSFYCLLKPFFRVHNSLINTWLKKAFIYCHRDNSSITCQTICARAPQVEMLLSSFSIAYVGMRRAVIIGHLFYFHILYLTEKWGCKQVYWETNSYLPLPFEISHGQELLKFIKNIMHFS